MPRYTVKNTVEVGRPVKVFVDGLEVDECFEADTDEGYALRHVFDDEGRPVFLPDGGIKSERVNGTVTVEHL